MQKSSGTKCIWAQCQNRAELCIIETDVGPMFFGNDGCNTAIQTQRW